MANTVLVLTRIAADNVDALNRSAIAETDIMNGTILTLEDGLSDESDKDFVFNATPLDDVDAHREYWMACSPEVNITGAEDYQYRGLNNDPRNFTNVAGLEFDVFSVQMGDIVQVSAPFFAEGFDPGTITGATVVEYDAGNTGMTAKTAGTASFEGIQFEIIKNFPLNIGQEAVPAWLLMRIN